MLISWIMWEIRSNSCRENKNLVFVVASQSLSTFWYYHDAILFVWFFALKLLIENSTSIWLSVQGSKPYFLPLLIHIYNTYCHVYTCNKLSLIMFEKISNYNLKHDIIKRRELCPGTKNTCFVYYWSVWSANGNCIYDLISS